MNRFHASAFKRGAFAKDSADIAAAVKEAEHDDGVLFDPVKRHMRANNETSQSRRDIVPLWPEFGELGVPLGGGDKPVDKAVGGP